MTDCNHPLNFNTISSSISSDNNNNNNNTNVASRISTAMVFQNRFLNSVGGSRGTPQQSNNIYQDNHSSPTTTTRKNLIAIIDYALEMVDDDDMTSKP